jgi:pimeloyl-ACP methyl ester carboxylesterase
VRPRAIGICALSAFVGVVFLASPRMAAAGSNDEGLRHVSVNGVDLAYVEEGSGDPVILIHGSANDYRTWGPQMGALSKKFHVIAYSRRYHYPNAPGDDGAAYTLALNDRDLLALIDSLKLGPVHLIGHSYGGQMAAFIARNHPELVKSVVLCEPPLPDLLSGSDRQKYLQERTEVVIRARLAIRDGFAELALRGLMDWAFGWPGYEQLPSKFRDNLHDNQNAFMLQTTSRAQDPTFGCDDAKSIQVPVLIIDGDKSAEARKDMCEALARCQPKAEHVTLKGASYGMNWQAAGGFNKAVLKFLEEHSAPPAPPVAAD